METGIYTAKEYTYLAIPKRAGTYTLQPEFTYFDPETATYETTQSKAYTITVSPGSEMPNVNVPNTQNKEIAEGLLDIRRQTELQVRSTPFFGTTAFWGLTALPLLLFLGTIVFKNVKNRQANIDPEILKQRKAEQVARQHLAQAKAHLEANKGRAFYDEVSKAMMGYINDKLNIPNSKLTKSVVQERLQVLNVPDDQTDSFMRILNACEMALFAGKDSTAEMQDIYERAVTALTKIEIR
jgi:hypothetical protein